MATPKSKHFQLDYLTRGASYSAKYDYRRFVTLDYNFESYIGVVGVGIIEGWDIQTVSGTTVEIIPGRGIINGYAVESQYSYKQRSDMVSGDREVEEVHDTTAVQPYMTLAERAVYVSVVQEYDPTFNPPLLIEDSFVKVVVPDQIVLPNNSQVYILAERVKDPSDDTPYPVANDFPISTMVKPKSGNYPNYNAYKAALAIYTAQVAQIHNYEWRANVDNHFTAVEFITSTTYNKDNNHILIGRVITGSGSILKIDISQVDDLQNMYATITSTAKEFLSGHKHGGIKYYDPPKIRLETDIRTAALKSYNSTSKVALFNVLERYPTTITLGHQHTYYLDADGNGYTVEQIGSTYSHFHKISDSIVGSPEYTTTTVETHIHSLPAIETVGGWISTSPFNVYINDVLFGDETSTNILADADAKTLTVYSGIGATYRTYTTSFEVITDSTAGTQETFTYTGSAYSVLQYMLNMEVEFNKKYGSTLLVADSSGTLNYSNHPFIFEGDAPYTIAGFDDLYGQCLIAQTMLEQIGDSFTFTPKAAKNISITLSDTLNIGQDYNVKIEIMGNTEVTGVLNAENILYIKASSIKTGTLDVARIPFVSHVGRMGEVALSVKYPMVSSDGIKYSVTPAITTTVLNHYHKLLLDMTNGGVTTQTFVGEDPVYYATGTTGNYYLIDHIHSVVKGEVNDSSSDGLLAWQNDVYSNNVTSSTHTHDVVMPVIGNPKIIYSVREGSSGIIYAGTSSGLYAIPQTESYLYVINGFPVYLAGSDLWEMLITAKELYEKETGYTFIATWDIYGTQVTSAYDTLLASGDSVLWYGYTNPNSSQDLVMVERLSYFEVPNFKYTIERQSYEVKDDEIIVGTKLINDDTGEEITEDDLNSFTVDDAPPITVILLVEKNISATPIWSIDINETSSGDESITAIGSDAWAQNSGLESDFYKTWESPAIPDFSGSLKKVFIDSYKDTWVASSGSLLASRSYQNNKVVEMVNQPGTDSNINDIVEGEVGAMYCASDKGGIYKTIDRGGTWTKVLNSIFGCSQILRDYTKDKTTTVSSHYHTLDVNVLGDGVTSLPIGSGVAHVHTISSWTIATTSGHTHTLIVSLYAVTNDGEIYASYDNGVNWSLIGETIAEEHSDLFAYQNLISSTKDGLYSLDDSGNWNKILDEMVYSFGHRYNFDGILLGCYNKIYQTDDLVTFTLSIEMEGNPQPILYLEGTETDYGYAYSSKDNSFRFKDLTYGEDNSFALVDFGKWMAYNGPWGSSSLYDIYIDNKIILSTKKSIDKQEETGYWFDVSPENGTLDFSAESSITQNVSVYDNIIYVSNSAGFNSGDEIYIKSESGYANPPIQNGTDLISVRTYYNSIKTYETSEKESRDMYFYGTVSDISGNQILLNENVDTEISLPANIYKIPNVNGKTSIKLNIYESPLSNIGTFTHDEIEDQLSLHSDGRPYQLNNAYLSNILQLTQAMRYVYPTIDSEFHNTKFYDFHYYCPPVGDPLDPYIGDEIDLYNTEVQNFSLFTNAFYIKGAQKVNRIIIGTDDFAGNIIVGTDIGIFWAKVEDGLEGNWFHVSSITVPVYDLKIFENVLFAATTSGTYTTQDMDTWTLQEQSPIRFPSTKIEFRWEGAPTVSVPAHTAVFSNTSALESNCGSVISTTGVYADLLPNRKLEISNAGSLSGVYTIKRVLTDKSILTYELFSSSVPVSFSGVTMEMGAWWEYFDGDINTKNASLSNTLLIGGKDKIAYCSNAATMVWSEAYIPPEVSNFQVSSFGIIDNGTIMGSTINRGTTNVKNHLMQSSTIGDVWNVFKTFDEVRGSITNSTITSFNHTKLFVSYSYPAYYKYKDGSECKKTISVFKNGEPTAIYTGDVIWNENNSDGDRLYVYGTELNSILVENRLSTITFITYPLKINSILESKNKSVLYGTDMGLYSDEQTMLGLNRYSGDITETSIGGTVSKIDTFGTIKSIYTNDKTGNVVMNIAFDDMVAQGDLIGYKLYVTDLVIVESYDVVVNSGSLVTGEISVEIATTPSDTISSYIGKRITIVGSSSRVYLTFTKEVSIGQFSGGKLYVASNENNNIGKEYNIVFNSLSFIDIQESIIPASTIAGGVNESGDLKAGQTVKVVDSSGRIELFVWFTSNISTNQLVGLNLSLESPQNTIASSYNDITIYSNTPNSIIVTTGSISESATIESTSITAPPLLFNVSDKFYINGFVFNPVPSFNNKRTSLVSGHYHDITTVEELITGDVSSFISYNSSFVDIRVSNTSGFNIPIVQLRNDLLTDAKISFYNSIEKKNWYETEIISFTSDSIKVNRQLLDMWDFSAYNKQKISTGWSWRIDASNYGYTSGIYYVDFVALYSQATADIPLETYTIYVESTSGMNIDDKIQIIDGSLKTEINYIDAIPDSTTITVKNPTSLYYYKDDVPVVKVLRDTFSNNHTHQIRSSQIETLYIQEYLDLGYNSYHSHESLSLLPSVAKLLQRNTETVAVGSTEKIFASYNNGIEWREIVDLDRFLEHDERITGLTDISLDGNNKYVVGTDNGYIATENLSTTVVPLEKPSV